MTTPAHDSVAYLPARPRLALLRKEADQLISFCLPCPLGLVFRRPRGRAICRVADSYVPYPSPVLRLDAACIRRLPRVVTTRWLRGQVKPTSNSSHSRDSASGESDERIRQKPPRNTREQETATNETVALINYCLEKLSLGDASAGATHQSDPRDAATAPFRPAAGGGLTTVK